MPLDQNPVHRKIIIPWYDSDSVCLITVVIMLMVCLFGFTGITVAQGDPTFAKHMAIPILLVALSGGVIVSITIRLIRRRLDRVNT